MGGGTIRCLGGTPNLETCFLYGIVLFEPRSGVRYDGAMTKKKPYRPPVVRQPLPRSFKDLTPAKHFNPRTFFREMVWKALLTRRTGEHRQPAFPRLEHGQV